MKRKTIQISGSRESGVSEGAEGDRTRGSIGTKKEIDLFLSEMMKIMGKT
jgi:hypothetical protein